MAGFIRQGDDLTQTGFDTVAQPFLSIEETQELHPTVAGNSGLYPVHAKDKALASRRVRILRSSLLVFSGLFLGFVIALFSSQFSDPVSAKKSLASTSLVTPPSSSGTPIETTIALPQDPALIQISTAEELQFAVPEELVELEQWFETQSVPLRERTFLNTAEKSFVKQAQPFSYPQAYGTRGKQFEGRLSATQSVRFKLNNPGQNQKKAAELIAETEAKLGTFATDKFQVQADPLSSSYVSELQQRRFGPSPQ